MTTGQMQIRELMLFLIFLILSLLSEASLLYLGCQYYVTFLKRHIMILIHVFVIICLVKTLRKYFRNIYDCRIDHSDRAASFINRYFMKGIRNKIYMTQFSSHLLVHEACQIKGNLFSRPHQQKGKCARFRNHIVDSLNNVCKEICLLLS